MARESEIPSSECSKARLPFPQTAEEEIGKQRRRTPEGHEQDDWIDDSFWLSPDMEKANRLPETTINDA